VPRPATPAVAVAASIPDETGFVSIIGQTYRKAKVRLALEANGMILQTIRADANGLFHFNTTVGFGRTQMRLFVTAQDGHRRTSIILPVVRVGPPVLAAPGTPPTTSNNSPGTSGSSQTGSQGGGLSPTNYEWAYPDGYLFKRWFADQYTLLPDSGGDQISWGF
jgi:hypothetical protein